MFVLSSTEQTCVKNKKIRDLSLATKRQINEALARGEKVHMTGIDYGKDDKKTHWTWLIFEPFTGGKV